MTRQTQLPELPDFESRLLFRLTEVVVSRPQDSLPTRARRMPVPGGRKAVGAFAVLALALGFAVLVPSLFTPRGTGQQAWALTVLPDGRVVIALDDLDHGNALIQSLRAEGIEASGTPEYASPGNVGKVASFLDLPEEGTPGFTWSPGSRFPVYINPDVFHGPITATIGVATPPGADYDFSESVFDQGEALAGLQCTLGVPITAADLTIPAQEAGFTSILWETEDASPIDAGSELVTEGNVIDAYPTNATTLEVRVAAADADVRPMYSTKGC